MQQMQTPDANKKQDMKPADDDPFRIYWVRELDNTWSQRNRLTIDSGDIGDVRVSFMLSFGPMNSADRVVLLVVVCSRWCFLRCQIGFLDHNRMMTRNREMFRMPRKQCDISLLSKPCEAQLKFLQVKS